MRTRAAAVFIVSLAVFLSNGRPHPEVDCVAAPFVAWSLAKHGTFDLSRYPQLDNLVGIHIQETPSGGRASMRVPGSALFALPVVAPLALFRQEPPDSEAMLQLGKIAAALAVAGAAALIFLTCRRLAPEAAWPVTVLFALGTCLFSVAAQALWMHGPAVFCLALALYLLTREDADSTLPSFLAGLALGMAVLCRPTTAFFAAASFVTLLARRRWASAAWLALGGLGPAALMLWYNSYHFGSPLLGGYAKDDWQTVPPLWVGLGGLLVAPSRGLFVYTPALLLLIPGVWLLCRSGQTWSPARPVLWAWLAASAATVLVYARWHDWRGGWCYGPRFLCETMPALCLVAGIGYTAMTGAWRRALANGLIALSLAVHLVGVFGHSGYVDWHFRHERQDEGRCLFELHDTQIEAHTRALALKLMGRKQRPG